MIIYFLNKCYIYANVFNYILFAIYFNKYILHVLCNYFNLYWLSREWNKLTNKIIREEFIYSLILFGHIQRCPIVKLYHEPTTRSRLRYSYNSCSLKECKDYLKQGHDYVTILGHISNLPKEYARFTIGTIKPLHSLYDSITISVTVNGYNILIQWCVLVICHVFVI